MAFKRWTGHTSSLQVALQEKFTRHTVKSCSQVYETAIQLLFAPTALVNDVLQCNLVNCGRLSGLLENQLEFVHADFVVPSKHSTR